MIRAMKQVIPRQVFSRLLPVYHFCFAFVSACICGFPSRRLTVIGVTGTKGKTTVVELLHHMLEATGDGVASASSLRFRIRDRVEANMSKMTMPGRFFVQRFLQRAARAHCRYAVIEVTSEGIRQFRHRFVRFDVAVFTNIAPEHIESHGGFEPYVRAKLDLFWRLRSDAIAVINADDSLSRRLRSATRAAIVEYGLFGVRVRDQLLRLDEAIVPHEADGIAFALNSHVFRSALHGAFNGKNVLAAIAAALALRVAPDAIQRGLAAVQVVAGRFEYVGTKKDVSVIVDYAHTPESLEACYQAALVRHQRLICVLGATGGGRDRWKRPVFGRIANTHCAAVFLTNEDPYDEDPKAIIADIARGVSEENARVRIVIDRKRAVNEAVRCARPGDAVVVTGKGAEPWMMGPNGTRTSWDDREVARLALRRASRPRGKKIGQEAANDQEVS